MKIPYKYRTNYFLSHYLDHFHIGRFTLYWEPLWKLVGGHKNEYREKLYPSFKPRGSAKAYWRFEWLGFNLLIYKIHQKAKRRNI